MKRMTKLRRVLALGLLAAVLQTGIAGAAGAVTDISTFSPDDHAGGEGVYCPKVDTGELLTVGKTATMELHKHGSYGYFYPGYATIPVTIVKVDITPYDLGEYLENDRMVAVAPRVQERWSYYQVTHTCDYRSRKPGDFGTSDVIWIGTVTMNIRSVPKPPPYPVKFGANCTVHYQMGYNEDGERLQCGRFLGSEPLRWRFYGAPVTIGSACTPPKEGFTRDGYYASCDSTKRVWVHSLDVYGNPRRLA